MGTTTKTLLTAVTALALAAAVHPSAIIRSSTSTAAAGSTIPVEGEEFSQDDMTTLVLRGALAEYELVDVDTDENGSFRIELAIPAEVRPGQYRLVALAPDGDVSASFDLTVTAAMAMGSGTHEDGEEDGHDDMGGMTAARADDMPIERSTSGIGWGIIGLLIGLAGGGGAALLTRS